MKYLRSEEFITAKERTMQSQSFSCCQCYRYLWCVIVAGEVVNKQIEKHHICTSFFPLEKTLVCAVLFAEYMLVLRPTQSGFPFTGYIKTVLKKTKQFSICF